MQDLQPVFEAIDRAGFVAVVARPGSFKKVFGRIKSLVYEHVNQANLCRSTSIGRSAFPLEAGADLAAMLPKGDTQ